jgi:hypothetical protein
MILFPLPKKTIIITLQVYEIGKKGCGLAVISWDVGA